jgi:hypothetical protein
MYTVLRLCQCVVTLTVKTLKIPESIDVKAQAEIEMCEGIHFNNILCTVRSESRCALIKTRSSSERTIVSKN